MCDENMIFTPSFPLLPITPLHKLKEAISVPTTIRVMQIVSPPSKQGDNIRKSTRRRRRSRYSPNPAAHVLNSSSRRGFFARKQPTLSSPTPVGKSRGKIETRLNLKKQQEEGSSGRLGFTLIFVCFSRLKPDYDL